MFLRGLFVLLVIVGWMGCDFYVKENDKVVWHDKKREVRYQIEDNDFVIVNGEKRFNRALYGSHTGFRVEAGDIPEFGLYMPRLGGTMRLGISNAQNSKWLIDADRVETRYRPGSMIYSIQDELLGSGTIYLHLLALPDADGMILKVKGEGVPESASLIWAFGGANGKRFSREGDLGADPESVFYLEAEKCVGNQIFIDESSFMLYYASGIDRGKDKSYVEAPEEVTYPELLSKKRIFGLVPPYSEMKIGDATKQESPTTVFNSSSSKTPLSTGKINLKDGEESFFMLVDPGTQDQIAYAALPSIFEKSEKARLALAERIKINTPDVYINAAGAALGVAADAVWDGEAFQHGSVAWRMPLNGWRGAYAADWLGWHDRARTHFDGYAKAQYTEPASGPSVPDPKANWARQQEKKGNSLYTDGYISRRPGSQNPPHHYDMNMVFIDQLLWHFQWHRDKDYAQKMWPLLKRHMAWEKRNFDGDGDGLYNAYASFWASDAVQYSGGGTAHASSYNYRSNRLAAQLAELVGEDPTPYKEEAAKILSAIQNTLWMDNKGWYAEFKDLLGKQMLHPSSAVWALYHTIDSEVPDRFQAYQTTRYIDNEIPHIPIEADGLPNGEYYTISTSNWMPYTWSVNSVALAEVLHTALAYWQSGRADKAFELTKGTFLDFMVLGSSPGNFGQLSFYDAFRGELYRDFADPIGMASRALVEGLFGIVPKGLDNQLLIQPGFPDDWSYASIETPDIKFDYKQNGDTDHFEIIPHILSGSELILRVKARGDKVKSVQVNGKEVKWELDVNAVNHPEIVINGGVAQSYKISVDWAGEINSTVQMPEIASLNSSVLLSANHSTIVEMFDPQKIFTNIEVSDHSVEAVVSSDCELGHRTAFVKLKSGEMTWWEPLHLEVRKSVEIISGENNKDNLIAFTIRNNDSLEQNYNVTVNRSYSTNVKVKKGAISKIIEVTEGLVTGRNLVEVVNNDHIESEYIINWNIPTDLESNFEMVEITSAFNDKVTNIFTPQYFSPRSPYPTQAIPTHGFGDWCTFDEHPNIDDTGLRQSAGEKGEIKALNIPFKTVGVSDQENIAFTSQWDNYPEMITVPLCGNGDHVYLLMAGSTHHMQFAMVSAMVEVNYKDGTSEQLELINPDTWYPIEQDYYHDGFAYNTRGVRPPRLYLKTGKLHLDSYDVLKVNGTNRIDGGAASILDLPLNPEKELDNLTLSTISNDVVIGLMGVTIKRD